MEENFILKNIGLIYLALKNLNILSEADEYFDVGMVGLVSGAKTYDSNSGYAPSTYLYKCIYNEILKVLRVENARKRIPKQKFLSIDNTLNCDEKLKYEDVIPDNINIENEILNKERDERIHDEINKLSAKEQIIINTMFEFNNVKMTQKELSKILNCTQATISRIRKRALKKLKKALNDIK